MKHPDYFLLGKILRPHGVKGDLVIYMDTDTPDRYKKIKLIYIDVEGQLKEFDISKINITGKDHLAIVHLSGIEDMNNAELYLKQELYLPLKELPALKGKKFYFHEIIGYSVIDVNEGELGELTNVYELPQHPVGEFMRKDKPVLFPLSEDLIKKIDRKERKLHIILPDGLLEVYE